MFVSFFCTFVLQRLSGSHKALVEMQDDVAELLRSATRDYASAKVCVYVCVFVCSNVSIILNILQLFPCNIY